MSDTAETSPPPLPADSSIHHKAARYVGIALAGGFILNLLFSIALKELAPGAGRIASLIAGLLFVSAVPAGIVALCGIPRYGRPKLLIGGLAGVIIPVLFIALAVPAFLKVRESSRQLMLKQIAQEMNKSVPQMIDDITRLDGAVAEPGHRLVINETILSLASHEIDRELWKKNALPTFKAAFAQSRLAPLVRNGATVVYRYHGKDNKLFDEVAYRPEDFPKE